VFTSPRNKESNERVKDERREQILSNALILFAKKGFAATKITDISAASGFSQGLIYHYYQSKEEIFVALIKNAVASMNAAAVELERLPLTPLEKIKLAIGKLLQGLEEGEQVAYHYLLINQAVISEAIPDEAKLIVEEQTLRYEVIARIISAGQREGSFKKYDARDMALLFWTSLNGLAIYKAGHADNFKVPDANILISMFVLENINSKEV